MSVQQPLPLELVRYHSHIKACSTSAHIQARNCEALMKGESPQASLWLIRNKPHHSNANYGEEYAYPPEVSMTVCKNHTRPQMKLYKVRPSQAGTQGYHDAGKARTTSCAFSLSLSLLSTSAAVVMARTKRLLQIVCPPPMRLMRPASLCSDIPMPCSTPYSSFASSVFLNSRHVLPER